MKYKNRIKKIEIKIDEDRDKSPRKFEDWLSFDDQNHSVKESMKVKGIRTFEEWIDEDREKWNSDKKD